VPDNQSNSDRTDEINQRKEDCIKKDCLDIRLAVFVVDLGKAALGFCFGIEYLHRLRAGEVLLEERVNSGYSRAHHVKAPPGALAKPAGRGEQHWHRN